MSKCSIGVIATGGTIAGFSENGLDEGYTSGCVDASKLFGDDFGCDIDYYQICNVNSDDITSAIWLEIYHKLNELAKSYDGFIITHGTDTLEETALFLSLTYSISKPVVLTGAMHPSNSKTPDGPSNFKKSVYFILNDKHDGVWVVFGNKILKGCEAYKSNTDTHDAFSSDGYAQEKIYNISSITELPKVAICYFAVDQGVAMLNYAIDNYDGVVIAGAGAGEFSKDFINAIESTTKPIVASSRINNTIVKPINLLTKKAIPSYNLNPQKTAVVLRLALAIRGKIE